MRKNHVKCLVLFYDFTCEIATNFAQGERIDRIRAYFSFIQHFKSLEIVGGLG